MLVSIYKICVLSTFLPKTALTCCHTILCRSKSHFSQTLTQVSHLPHFPQAAAGLIVLRLLLQTQPVSLQPQVLAPQAFKPQHAIFGLKTPTCSRTQFQPAFLHAAFCQRNVCNFKKPPFKTPHPTLFPARRLKPAIQPAFLKGSQPPVAETAHINANLARTQFQP